MLQLGNLSTWIAVVVATTAAAVLVNNQIKGNNVSAQGCSVVIVGASSGIGRHLALEYVQGGAQQVILCARRKEQLEQVAQECRAINERAEIYTVIGDITQRDTQLALRDMAADKIDQQKGLDHLVLNAGAISVQPILLHWEPKKDETQAGTLDRVEAAMRRIMAVNAEAPIMVAGLFLPMLIKSQGRLAVVSSMAGLIAAPTRSLYSASKHAMAGYFSAMRMEVARYGVSVTIAYPATVDTDLRHSAVDISDDHTTHRTIAHGSTKGKLPPWLCARQILIATVHRKRSLVTPWSYSVANALYWLCPSLVEHLAKKKYGLV